MLTVTPLLAFNDNYIWVIQHPDVTGVYVVDPGDAEVVMQYLHDNDLPLLGILITHHHHDHTGGINTLNIAYGDDLPIYGPDKEAISGVNIPLQACQHLALQNIGLNATIIDVPGHTLGHIAYVIDDHLFCGDTLFSAGCGRLFEGTAAQMLHSLTQLADLPENTKVYCTHEYTLANLTFANAVDPTNAQLQDHRRHVQQLRSNNIPSLPSSIALEKSINPFLRCHSIAIRQSLAEQFQQPITDNVSCFSLLRQWKDNF
ncbi:hydroxyacylglutathione hydrolase [Shewanella sp.]|nr:hydroxyacylglutathione hydrolase [Shewanella sp.]